MSRALRRAFIDAVNGWSKIKIKDQSVYLRHLNHRDHLDLEDIQEEFFQEALSLGLPDLKTREQALRDMKLWDDKKDRIILDQKAYVEGMIKGRKNIHLPSILNKLNEQIKDEEIKLRDLEWEKSELIGLTAEGYAQRRSNDFYLVHSLYSDQEMKTPLFKFEEFDELPDADVNEIIRAYNNGSDICSDKILKTLCIQDFYQSYYYLCEDDFMAFFGRPIVDLTFVQVKLANYSRYFKSILEGTDVSTLPEKARNDPDELIAYLDVRKKGQEMLEKAGSASASLVGATAEDIKAISGGEKVSNLPQKPMSMMELIKARKNT